MISGADLWAVNILLNGTKATIVSNTATKIIAKVPAGATSGRITVTTLAGTATSHSSFTVT